MTMGMRPNLQKLQRMMTAAVAVAMAIVAIVSMKVMKEVVAATTNVDYAIYKQKC